MKLYFDADDGEYAYPLAYFRDKLRAEGKTSIDLIEAKKYRDCCYFYCKHYDWLFERGDCGRCCEFYSPRNGKSGCCKHVGTTYEQSDERFTLHSNH